MEQVDLPGDRLWTVAETPYFLGVPVGTLYYWRCRGEGLMLASSVGIFGTGLRTSVHG